MHLADLKKFHKSGIIDRASILPNGELWVVECHMLNGNKEKIARTRTTETKLYKTIAGAIADVKSAGFDKVEVYFSS